MVIRWFCESCYGVVGSEGDSNISVFKQVGDSAYMCGEVKVKVSHFGLFSVLVGVWRTLFCVVFGVLIWRVVGILLFFAMWRMACHSLRCWSLLRRRLNVLSL